MLSLIEEDLRSAGTSPTGACGLSVESVLRCLLLKQMLGVSYEQLAFHLSDSPSYRSFARLRVDQTPSRSGLQSAIRRFQPQTLAQVNRRLMTTWVSERTLSVATLRIDSTVVDSNIAAPSDSQLLADGVRVLSRLMAKSREVTGVKIRFTDQRQRSKSLAFRIFNGKKAAKQALYPELLRCAGVTLRQSRKATGKVAGGCGSAEIGWRWIDEVVRS